MSSWSSWCGVALGAALAGIVVACAASQPMTAASVPPSAPPSQASVMPGDPHAQIEQLAGKIASERHRLGLPDPETSPIAAATCQPACPIEPMAVTPVAQDPTCHPAKTDACEDVCRLGGSICDDAASICKIAKEMATDAWAAGKCSEAQASCTSAHARCCDCK
jgi:hypothetical protein